MDVKPYKGFVVWHLLWSNLGVRPLRSALSVLALSLQVFLVLLIVGLTSGALSDWRTRAEGIGADIIVQPPNSSIFFAFSSAVMPETLVDKIASLPGVDEVAPVLIVVDQHNLGVIYGIDYGRFAGLSSGFSFLSGGPFQQPTEAMADDLAAHSRKLQVGATTTLMGHEFTISGIVLHGKGARFFIPLKTARDIGILKALGSSRLEICGMIVGETLVMVALGVAFGLLCTYTIVAILHRTSPTLQVEIEGAWIVRAILLTILGAVAGAIYPALRAAQSDPVDALAYE